MHTSGSFAKPLRNEAVVTAGEKSGDLRMVESTVEFEFDLALVPRCAKTARHSRVFFREGFRRKTFGVRFGSLRLSKGVLQVGN